MRSANPPSKIKAVCAHVDPGIAPAVRVLMEAGIETFESCQGGAGHCFPEPTVRFSGGREVGHRAVAAALTCGLNVSELRRVWCVIQGEPTGPHWELTFTPGLYESIADRQELLNATQHLTIHDVLAAQRKAS